jgi:hypothetical protein
MTRLDAPLQELRRARAAMTVSWARTLSHWRDNRAREYESLHHASLEHSASVFEKALEDLDREVDQALRRLPD